MGGGVSTSCVSAPGRYERPAISHGERHRRRRDKAQQLARARICEALHSRLKLLRKQ
jgi:hypothetical protein